MPHPLKMECVADATVCSISVGGLELSDFVRQPDVLHKKLREILLVKLVDVVGKQDHEPA